MAGEFTATENGNIKISDEVIVRISAYAAREVEGVAGLGSGTGLGDLLNKNIPAKGIKVEITEESTVVEVHVTVKFGVKINDIGFKIQEAVKNAVEEYAGLENVMVNVFVDGLEREIKDVKEVKETKEPKAEKRG